jgi:hypothetical protein
MGYTNGREPGIRFLYVKLRKSRPPFMSTPIAAANGFAVASRDTSAFNAAGLMVTDP